MVSAGVESPVQRRAARADLCPAFVCSHNGFWRQKKIHCRGHAHLNVQPRRVDPVGEADDRRLSAIVAYYHPVAALSNGLGFQQSRSLSYFRLVVFLAEKDREPPLPI